MIRSLVAACAVLFTTSLHAAPLLPGTFVDPAPAHTVADPVLGGVQLVKSDEFLPFLLDPDPATPFTAIGGNIQSRATEQVSTGFYVFAPRIRDTFNVEAGVFAITSMILTGYAGFDVQAGFRTDGVGDKGPTSYSRSVDGDTITMRFTTGVDQGGLVIDRLAGGLTEESLFPTLLTNATRFQKTGTATIGGYFIDENVYYAGGGIVRSGDFVTATIGGLAVPAPIPLPASALLLLGGIAGMGAMRRRNPAR